eukprot:CAMPEP_0185746220 /NCGR_PEP_ID=MMETSP1174-20130828/4713_1 /TAXON_ID=35687 /ORGANISM="Dictyocha speculum, Strain CCMP1381" /LENGTH=35 /DNA_ID= /DNA_START= /DNA_END= /DNA_ORIENTATION=
MKGNANGFAAARSALAVAGPTPLSGIVRAFTAGVT